VEADAGALEVGAAWRWLGRSRSAWRGGRCQGHGGAEAGPALTAGASRAAGVEGSGVETARRWTTRHGGGGGRSGVEGAEGASQRSTIGHWRGSRVGGRRTGLYTLALRYRVKT